MEFKNLSSISIQTILDTFNLAFSDYIIPLQLDLDKFQKKLFSEDINWTYSIGAIDNGQLVGFILHFNRHIDNTTTLYNGGTGVIPAYRGQQLTVKMYQYFLNYLLMTQQQNIESVHLEVLTPNTQAIKAYQNVGFEILNMVHCYQAQITLTDIPLKPEFVIKEIDFDLDNQFHDYSLTWQNTLPVIRRLQEDIVKVGAFHNEQLIGYIIFNKSSKKIHQIAVDKNFRHQGIGQALLQYIAQHYTTQMGVINVHQDAESLIQFLLAQGFQHSISQYDMRLNLG